MSGILDSVDQRTQLVGENRLELLMFRLSGHQLFAINVFKIKEVVPIPALTLLPNSHPVVVGVTHLREQTIPVIDLAAAIGGRAIEDRAGNIIVTEYNRSVQAFLIGPVERIVNLNWEEILPPPTGMGRSHFLTAITRLDEKLVEIVDVERVLADIVPYDTSVSNDVLDSELVERAAQEGVKVLIADDSSTARAQVRDTMRHLGIEVIETDNGLKALNYLKSMVQSGKSPSQELLMLVTDAEMPEMDGYRLTSEIRKDPNLKNLHVVLHTSLSGSFNEAMVEKVGCDGFLSKFQPDDLAKVAQARLRDYFNA